MTIDVQNTEEAASESSIWYDWGGTGPVLHFAHANGFPPGTYRKLIGELTGSHHVVSMAARPLWPDENLTTLRDWMPFSDDLRAELNRRQLRGIVGIGHSLGAVTSLLASVADSGLFSAVVAIDPLILTGFHSFFWGAAKTLGLADRLHLVRGARRRRELWSDRDQARTTFSAKKIFAGWDPEVLDDYLLAGFVDGTEGEIRLHYPKEWEARIFAAAPHNLWTQLKQLRVPTLFLQGENTDTFLEPARIRIKREVPGARTEVVRGTSHFLPMERPGELARVIDKFLAEQPSDQHKEAESGIGA